LYSWSLSWISTCRWPTYRAETCCIPTVLLGMCNTQISLLWVINWRTGVEKHNRQCTYNRAVRRVRVIIVAAHNQYVFSVCVCGLAYSACKAHEPYCIFICGLSVCLSVQYTFKHYSTNGTIFENKNWTQNVCFLTFSTTTFFSSKTYLVLRRTGLDVIINIYRLFLSDFNESWNYRKYIDYNRKYRKFKKYSNIAFNETWNYRKYTD